MLELKDISVRFDGDAGPIEALTDIDLTIRRGTFVCIVGPSGCGKTTLLNLIAGFIRPTSGEALLDGKPINGPGADRAVIFQQPVALLPWLNVADNVGFGLKLQSGTPRSKQEKQEIVERYLKMVGLWDFRKRAIYELSGGMQQRVALCRVLAIEPRMLLMDEPFGALDALTREKMQVELFRLSRQTEKTVLFITHSVEEAIFLGTTVMLMSARPGRIIERFDVNIGAGSDGGDVRHLKSHPDFVTLRDKLLGLIWNEDGPGA